MKDETAGVAIEEFVGLKLKLYWYLVDDNSEHKKEKGVNRNVVATISHNEYEDILLSKKSLRHSMNRFQIEDHKIGTYEINYISLSCFDAKIYVMWWTSSWLLELIIKKQLYQQLLKKLFCQANCFNFQSNQDSFFLTFFV